MLASILTSVWTIVLIAFGIVAAALIVLLGIMVIAAIVKTIKED